MREGVNRECALIVWIPRENEILSPLEGQLDVVANGPRNLPRDTLGTDAALVANVAVA